MPKRLEDYLNVVEDKIIAEIFRKARKLHKKHILNLNSTFIGGGVAEILDSIVPLMNSTGLDYGWRILHGCPDFYNITKKFHNGLQGEDVCLSKKEKELYLKINEEFSSYTHINHDYVIIHDPQPLPMAYYLKQDQPWICRIHVDLSNPNKKLWDFLKTFIFHYNVLIVSMEEYKKKDLPIDQVVIPPAIDPLSQKNMDISKSIINRYIKELNIPMDKPIITQVSRMDKWKDPIGVLRIYEKVKQKMDCRLLYCFNLASDDPEGMDIYNEVLSEAKGFIDSGDIIMISKDDKLMVNVIQNISEVIIQKSTKEGFCVLPNTKIITDIGRSEIKDLHINDKVLTGNGSFKPIKRIMSREVEFYYNLCCWKGMNLGITKEHPVFAAKRGTKQNFGKLEWIKVENLKVGDYIATSIPKSEKLNLILDLKEYDNNILYDEEYVYYKFGYSGKRKLSYKYLSNILDVNKGSIEKVVKYIKDGRVPKIKKHIWIYKKLLELNYELPEVEKVNRFIDMSDKEIQWLCGLYIGNGSNNGNFIELCFNKNKLHLVEKIKNILKNKFNKESNIGYIDNKVIICCSSKILVKFFKQFGEYATNKHIPNEWLKYGNNLKYMLVGLFDSDGHYCKSSASYDSINNELIWQIWYILLTLKIPTKITENIIRKTGFNHNSYCNSLQIGGKEYHKFSNDVISKIHTPLNDNSKRKSNLCIVLDDYILYPIKKIEKVYRHTKVYDIEIEDIHSFVANGYLVHNCLAVAEGLWKETPVVASNVGGIPSQIIDGETGYLLDPHDYDGFADRIIELLNNKNLCKEIGKRGKEHIRNNFLITRLMDDYLNLLLSMF